MDLLAEMYRCNNMFKGDLNYAGAMVCFQNLYDNLPNTDDYLKDRLICLARIMDCIWEQIKPPVNNETFRQFVEQHQQKYDMYVPYLAQAPEKEVAPDVVLNLFGQHLYITSLLQEYDCAYDQMALKNSFTQMIGACSNKNSKVPAKSLFQKGFSVISEVSLDVSRSSLLESVKTLCGALLEVLPVSDEYRALRCAIYNRLANTALFFPTETDPRIIWKMVEDYLEKALSFVPNDIFARTMLKNVRTLRMTHHQIRGFQHDINTHISRMEEWAKAICDDDQHPSPKDMILSGIDALQGLANLAKQENLSEEDCKCTNIGTLLLEIVAYHTLPASVVTHVGQPDDWLISTGLVHQVITNLVKNSKEAYDSRGLSRPDELCQIKINYADKKVYYRDFAGGITLEGDIFEPYMSEKGIYGERGLGLTQARNAMRLQEYDIYLDPEQPDGGAAFILDFNRKKSTTGEATHV